MDRNKALLELKKVAANDDIEVAHQEADWVLCELLKKLGYGDVVEAYCDIPKWYA